MKTINIRHAKAGLSALIDAAAKGEPAILTKHGSPTAMLVPYKLGLSLYPKRSFADALLAMPHAIDIEVEVEAPATEAAAP